VQAMTFHTEYLWFTTTSKREYINITGDVEAILRKSGIREGIVLVSAMHITASVYINDAEDGLLHDIDAWLEHLAPFRSTISTIGPAKQTVMHTLKVF